MEREQFRILYRQFLFRMADVEALSSHAQGDSNKLLGQFASLLIMASIVFALPALGGSPPAGGAARLGIAVVTEHFLISTTMLVVGLFAVLCWDTLLPDQRDVLTLAPLPVRGRTLFLAKAAAVGTALAMTIAVLHAATGLVWPAWLSTKSEPAVVPAYRFDAPLPPVSAEQMQTTLTRDLPLPLEPGLGLAVGVLRDGVRRSWTYGEAQRDTLYEVGSLSKTFTAMLLAQMVAEGRVRLDDSLPWQDITYLDLATHHSGMGNMPDNLHPFDRRQPYADYDVQALYKWARRHRVLPRAERGFQYSNGAFSVLGQELASRAGVSFEELLEARIATPLGLRNTAVRLTPDQERRFAQGRYNGRPVPRWDMAALAPAGGVRSTVDDVLTYLGAWFGDDMRVGRELYADGPAGRRVALAWMYDPKARTYWHDGGTGGYASYAFFSPEHNWAGIVLLNHGPRITGSPQVIGEHLRQRLAGEPAVSLRTVTVPGATGLRSLPRWFAAYWITMLAAGAFIFCSILAIQGLAAQLLPRRLFLRASGWLQIGAFCFFVGGYFLEPKFPTFDALISADAQRVFVWSPAYWFLGVFHGLNGMPHPALADLGRAAWTAFGIAAVVAILSYWMAYLRTLRKIVESPEIAPSVSGLRRLPAFGGPLPTAVAQFSIRTLMRSRQHRLILAFYLGIGFALTIFLLKTPVAAKAPLFAASILNIGFAVAGMRVVFALPLDLRANWLFRATPVGGGIEMLRARRRALIALAVAPVWTVSIAACLWTLPVRLAIGHAVVLGLVGLVAAEAALFGPVKIPFTCSYLPGKSNLHITFWMCITGIEALIAKTAEFEIWALGESWGLPVLSGVLAIVLLVLRFAKDPMELRFEEEPSDAVVRLGISA